MYCYAVLYSVTYWYIVLCTSLCYVVLVMGLYHNINVDRDVFILFKLIFGQRLHSRGHSKRPV